MDNIYKTPDAELNRDSETGRPVGYAFYKISGIGVATFFGTIVAGGYLVSKNLRALGRHEEAKKVLLGSVIALIGVLAVGWFLPADLPGINTAFTVAQIVIMVQLAKKWLQTDLEAHQAAGGRLASNWKAFGIALLFLLALLVLIIPIVFITM